MVACFFVFCDIIKLDFRDLFSRYRSCLLSDQMVDSGCTENSVVVGNIGAANRVLDHIPDKKRGMGIILCLIDKKTYLRENLITLPIDYI